MKIYIVEDDRVLRTELMKLLNSYGYECAYSDDWQNIIQLALQESPDLPCHYLMDFISVGRSASNQMFRLLLLPAAALIWMS